MTLIYASASKELNLDAILSIICFSPSRIGANHNFSSGLSAQHWTLSHCTSRRIVAGMSNRLLRKITFSMIYCQINTFKGPNLLSKTRWD
jgi:hypothetical protein